MTYNVDSNDHSPQPAAAGKVESGSAVPATSHVSGPTPIHREPAFGHGLAAEDRAPTCTRRSNESSVAARPGRNNVIAFPARKPDPDDHPYGGGAAGGRKHRRRMPVKAAVTLLAAAMSLGLLVSGCGAAASDTATPPEAAPPTSTPSDAGSLVSSDGTSGDATTVGASASGGYPQVVSAPGSQVRTSQATPPAFTKAVGKSPIVVVFYQPQSTFDSKVLAQASTAAHAVKGVKFFSYPVGDYSVYQDLPGLVGAYSSPSVAVIDRSGVLQNFWSTYVDSGLIETALRQAAAAKPATVSPSDVPATGGSSDATATAAAPGTDTTSAPGTDDSGVASPPPTSMSN